MSTYWAAHQLGQSAAFCKIALTLEEADLIRREEAAEKRRRNARRALVAGVPLAVLGFGASSAARALQNARFQAAIQRAIDEQQRLAPGVTPSADQVMMTLRQSVSPTLQAIAQWSPYLGWTGLGMAGYGLLRGG